MKAMVFPCLGPLHSVDCVHGLSCTPLDTRRHAYEQKNMQQKCYFRVMSQSPSDTEIMLLNSIHPLLSEKFGFSKIPSCMSCKIVAYGTYCCTEIEQKQLHCFVCLLVCFKIAALCCYSGVGDSYYMVTPE